MVAEAEHGSDYQRARQQYLRTLAADPNQPRYVRGWATQEANRLGRIATARSAGKTPPGGDPYRYKGIPGYDVGHKLGKHGQHEPANFRLEWARDNRARPGHARSLGVQHKWREGEFEADLELAAEQMNEDEPFDGRGTNRLIRMLDGRLARAAGAAGTTAILFNQGQVNHLGQRVMTGRNPTKPDLAYLTRWQRPDGVAQNLRVNIETDTKPRSAMNHLTVNRRQDPTALNYALITHPETGAILGGRVFDPRYGSGGIERRLSRRELNYLNAGVVGQHGLPLPRQATDPGYKPPLPKRVSSKVARLFNIRAQ